MMHDTDPMIEVIGLSKGFTLHVQGGVHLGVLDGINLAVHEGECLVLDAPSGRGKGAISPSAASRKAYCSESRSQTCNSR